MQWVLIFALALATVALVVALYGATTARQARKHALRLEGRHESLIQGVRQAQAAAAQQQAAAAVDNSNRLV
jgi:hypothetical protein